LKWEKKQADVDSLNQFTVSKFLAKRAENFCQNYHKIKERPECHPYFRVNMLSM